MSSGKKSKKRAGRTDTKTSNDKKKPIKSDYGTAHLRIYKQRAPRGDEDQYIQRKQDTERLTERQRAFGGEVILKHTM